MFSTFSLFSIILLLLSTISFVFSDTNTCSKLQYKVLISAILHVKNTLPETETINREYLINFALNEEALTAECWELMAYWNQFGSSPNEATRLKFLDIAKSPKYSSEGVDPHEELPTSFSQYLSMFSKAFIPSQLSDSTQAILQFLKNKEFQSWYINKVSKIASQSPYLQQVICMAGQMSTCDYRSMIQAPVRLFQTIDIKLSMDKANIVINVAFLLLESYEDIEKWYKGKTTSTELVLKVSKNAVNLGSVYVGKEVGGVVGYFYFGPIGWIYWCYCWIYCS
jgi:hypothetical protein